MTKICGCCNIEKSTVDFNKKSTAKDGLQSKCKVCASNHYNANKIEILAKSKEYYEKNKDKKLNTLKNIEKKLNLRELSGKNNIMKLTNLQ